MTSALTLAVDELPDLLGTAPADLVDQNVERPAAADLATARQRAERIRADFVAYARMRQDIADAYACRDWIALGYSSWYSYVDGEFGRELQHLARDRAERQLAVRDLQGQGLSTRQTGKVLGVDPKTVRNDLDGLPAAPGAKVRGTDGKQYPARRPKPAPVEITKEPTHWHCRGCGHSWPIVAGEANLCPECGERGSFTPADTHSPAGAAAAATTGAPAAPPTLSGTNSPAGPADSAHDPRAETVFGESRPQDRPGDHPSSSPAGTSAAASPPTAPAPTPQEDRPGTTTTDEKPLRIAGTSAEIYEYGSVQVGDRTLRVRAGRLAADDVPVVWLAVEDAGAETELLALSPLKAELLITRLESAHRWSIGALREVAS